MVREKRTERSYKSTTISPGLTKPRVLKLQLRISIIISCRLLLVTSSTAPFVYITAAEHNSRDIPIILHVKLRVFHPGVIFLRAGCRGVQQSDMALAHLTLVDLGSARDSSAFERSGNRGP